MDTGGGNVEQEVRSDPWHPTAIPLHDTIMDMKRVTDRPREIFPGQLRAGFNPMERGGYEAQLGFSQQGMPGMYGMGQQAWESMLNAPDVANNPYVQGMISQQAETLNRNFSELLPSIRTNMIGVNERLGGSGQGVAEGIAARGTQEALARQMAQTQMDAYRAGLGSQSAGMGMMPQVMAAGLMPGQMQIDYGRRLAAEEQREIDEARYRHDYAYEEPLERKERLLRALIPVAGLGGTRTTKQEVPGSSLGANILGGGLALAGTMGNIGQAGGLSNIFSNFWGGSPQQTGYWA